MLNSYKYIDTLNTILTLLNSNKDYYYYNLQMLFCRFLLSLIMLEHEVNLRKGDSEEKTNTHDSSSHGELRYLVGRALPQQPMLLAAILRALEAPGRAAYAHTHWTALVTCALPYLGNALTRVVTAVVRQLCSNVEYVSKAYDAVDCDLIR